MGLYRYRHPGGARAPARLRRRISVWTSIGAAAALSACVLVASLLGEQRLEAAVPQLEGPDRGPPRRRLSDDESMYPEDPLINRPHKNARPWLIWVHIIVISYMLLGLNTVCDLYFTGALDEMVNKWDIKPDVAGATFMAAGGSAPELFTSLIGAIVTSSDVGFGTIVGSAVFNVLFVIGLCGFAAKEPIKLTWWPLFRDCTYYICGLSVLALFARTGGSIELWEAIVLFLGYVGYCVLMYFNPVLEAVALKSGADQVTGFQSSSVTPDAPVADTGSTPADKHGHAHHDDNDSHHEHHHDKHHIKKSQPHFERKATSNLAKAHSREHLPDVEHLDHQERKISEATAEARPSHCSNADPEEEEEDDIEALLMKPEGNFVVVLWYLCLPIYAPLFYLTPKPTERLFMATFLVSLLWIAGFSLLLVYCVEILGGVLRIHIIVMGFTLLAAGTSIPDLVSSLAVARAGEGDMAVSSSIGSNIFDILFGLPIPWVIKILIVEMGVKGKDHFAVRILSEYIVLYVLILIFMVLCVVLSIHVLKWYLSKPLGLGMALLYAIFLTIVLVVEFSKPEALMF